MYQSFFRLGVKIRSRCEKCLLNATSDYDYILLEHYDSNTIRIAMRGVRMDLKATATRTEHEIPGLEGVRWQDVHWSQGNSINKDFEYCR